MSQNYTFLAQAWNELKIHKIISILKSCLQIAKIRGTGYVWILFDGLQTS